MKKPRNKQKQEISAFFPLQPYQIQVQLANSIYNNLQASKTKILIAESPTGTGKTYSLLVGACKWLNDHPYQSPQKNQSQSKLENKTKVPTWLIKKNGKSEQIVRKKAQMEKELIDIQDAANQMKIQRQELIKKKKEIGIKNPNLQKNQQLFDDLSDTQQQQKQINIQKKRKQFPLKNNLLLQNQNQASMPRIIFLSRTHSQLKQVIDSFKKILHNFNIKSLILSSKNNLCINPAVNNVKQSSNSNSINEKCQYLMDHLGCKFYHKLKMKNFFDLNLQESYNLGKSKNLCSYYSLRNLTEQAGLLCLPYISILDQKIRSSLNINIKNSIMIFDQAHNVFDYQLQLLSPQINYLNIAILKSRVQEYLCKYQNKMIQKHKILIRHICQICLSFMNILKKEYQKVQKLTFQQAICYYRKMSTIDLQLQMKILQIRVFKLLSYFQISNFDKKLVHFSQTPFSSLILPNFMKFLYRMTQTDSKNEIILLKSNILDGAKKIQLQNFSFKILTLQSNTINKIISQSRLTIFAGGTMYPLDQFAQVKKKYTTKVLTYSHMIGKENCHVYCVNSYKHERIVFNFLNFKTKLIVQLEIIKQSLLKITANINKLYANQKAGIVCFLQNYNFIEILMKELDKQGLPSLIFDSKKQKGDPLKTYESTLQKQKRAILLSVVGGSFSQGINFSDQLARAIVLFGMPYPNSKAPQIVQRRQFYDKKQKQLYRDDIIDIDQGIAQQESQLNGQKFYQNLCTKAINQTIGRGIRHKNDKADIYLIDYRFQKNKNQLSSWLRDRVIIKQNLQDL